MKLHAVLLIAGLFIALLLSGCSHTAAMAPEEGSEGWKIDLARSAGPASITADATIVDFDGSVLVEGTNGWVCSPGMNPDDPYPLCNDQVWVDLIDALMKQEDFSPNRVGISYMLQGDSSVNNADPYDTEPGEGEVWIQEGPHLMIIVPHEALEGLTDDPYAGGPYVMWKDTPYAHIMVPLAEERPPRP